MDSILKLASPPTEVALMQAHSHKKLIGFCPAAEHCHERSSQAPGDGLGRNCRSLHGWSVVGQIYKSETTAGLDLWGVGVFDCRHDFDAVAPAEYINLRHAVAS